MSGLVNWTNELEQRMLDHVEMVFSVAVQLSGNTHDAEKLTRVTICQALRMPDVFSGDGPMKKELLALLRRNFVRSRRAKKFSMLLKIAGALEADGAEQGSAGSMDPVDSWGQLAYAGDSGSE